MIKQTNPPNPVVINETCSEKNILPMDRKNKKIHPKIFILRAFFIFFIPNLL